MAGRKRATLYLFPLRFAQDATRFAKEASPESSFVNNIGIILAVQRMQGL